MPRRIVPLGGWNGRRVILCLYSTEEACVNDIQCTCQLRTMQRTEGDFERLALVHCQKYSMFLYLLLSMVWPPRHSIYFTFYFYGWTVSAVHVEFVVPWPDSLPAEFEVLS